jgi:polyisoprenoid-binding protein YceI
MPVPRPELTGDYDIDSGHSRLGFVARHAMITKVRGSFKKFDLSAVNRG